MSFRSWLVAWAVVTLMGHAIIWQWFRIDRLSECLELSHQARRLESEQVRDLMFAFQNAKIEKESVSVRAYVEGVVRGFSDEEHYAQIWHDGYDRATAVEAMVKKLDMEEPIPDKKVERKVSPVGRTKPTLPDNSLSF